MKQAGLAVAGVRDSDNQNNGMVDIFIIYM